MHSIYCISTYYTNQGWTRPANNVANPNRRTKQIPHAIKLDNKRILGGRVTIWVDKEALKTRITRVTPAAFTYTKRHRQQYKQTKGELLPTRKEVRLLLMFMQITGLYLCKWLT